MMRTESEYIFADAFIGCSVANLMGQNDLVRLANCGDLTAADTILQEHGYLECKEIAAGDIETFIRREQKNLYELMFHNIAGREEMAPYLFPFDYHNAKVCIKAELTGATPDEELLISTGEIEAKVMVAMIRDRHFDRMRPIMRDAITEAFDTYSRGNDPQEIDLILDRACYKDMARHAEETESDFIRNIIATEVDMLNLKNFARLKRMDHPWNFFQKVYLEAGSIKEDAYLASYEEPFVQFADKIVNPNLAYAVKEGGRALEETGSFVLLEKLLRDAVMEENKKGKFVSFGIEPIAGFWYAKEVEIDNIRIILMALLRGIDPDLTVKMLYKPYVG